MNEKYYIGGFEKRLGSPVIEGEKILQSYKITLALFYDEKRNGRWREWDFRIVLKPKSKDLKPICRNLKGKCMTIEEIDKYFLDNSVEYTQPQH